MVRRRSFHSGLLFPRNACTPSTASSLAQRVANRWIVRHNAIHQTVFFGRHPSFFESSREPSSPSLHDSSFLDLYDIWNISSPAATAAGLAAHLGIVKIRKEPGMTAQP